MTEQPPGALPDPSQEPFTPPVYPGASVPPPAGAMPPPPAAPMAPPAQPYGQAPAAPYGLGAVLPKHPSATTALVLGIVGLAGGFLTCGALYLMSPFAWGIGAKAVREIRASQGTLGGESEANTGKILGIIGTVLLALAILVFLAYMVFVIAVVATGQSDGSY